ncbi:MAG: hypothetical protein E7624_05250 [Ruminococcaceae bacterium]|nr:hypothetical protein [Oscillospiraceae bacterium]
MDFLGNWKLKKMLSADENGVKMFDRAEIEAMGDEDLLKMLAADFIISESAIDVYYQPTEEEMPMVEEEGWELTEKGVLIDSYPAKIESGVLYLDYERDGAEYTPVEIDEEGCLLIGDTTAIEKV